MTLYVLRQFLRQRPDAQITLMIADPFKSVSDIVPGQIDILAVDTSDLRSVLSHLAERSFDEVINLSFSPLASEVTFYYTKQKIKTLGYTRTQDGYFSPCDDASAYFYAQVGESRRNRIHLTQIFAQICSIDLPLIQPARCEDISDRTEIIFHPFASDRKKSLQPAQISQIVAALVEKKWVQRVHVVGGAADQSTFLKCGSISHMHFGDKVETHLGEWSWLELFEQLKKWGLFLGCDSAPLHVANLAEIPAVNLSTSAVNYWETGPLVEGSIVLPFESMNQVDAEYCVEALESVRMGRKCKVPHVVRVGGEFHGAKTDQSAEQEWCLIQSIYLGEPLSIRLTEELHEASARMQNLLQQQRELNQKLVSTSSSSDVMRQLGCIDAVWASIEEDFPLSPLVRWYQTQRLRIPPSTLEEVFEQTQKCLSDLEIILIDFHRQMVENLKHHLYRSLLELTEYRRCVSLSLRCGKFSKGLKELSDLTHILETVDQDVQFYLAVRNQRETQGLDQAKEWASLVFELVKRGDYVRIADACDGALSFMCHQWMSLVGYRNDDSPRSSKTASSADQAGLHVPERGIEL